MARKYNSVTPHQAYAIRALHQRAGLPVSTIIATQKRLLKDLPKSTVYRHSKIPLENHTVDKRINNRNSGRPSKFTDRHKRILFRAIQKFRNQDIDFTAIELFEDIEMDLPSMNITTFRRFLHKCGYGYLTNRKKGSYQKRIDWKGQNLQSK